MVKINNTKKIKEYSWNISKNLYGKEFNFGGSNEKDKDEIDEDVKECAIIDIIFLMSLFGNDFLHSLPSLSIVNGINNIIYIYSYYIVSYFQKKNNREYTIYHKNNNPKKQKDQRKYVPSIDNMVMLFDHLNNFEEALVMDTYLSNANNNFQKEYIAQFGSVFTFYYAYTYAKLANNVYQIFLKNNGSVLLKDVIESINISDIINDNHKSLYLFMDMSGGRYDTTLSAFDDGVLRKKIDPIAIDMVRKIEVNIETDFPISRPNFVSNISKIGSLNDIYYYRPKFYYILYHGIILNNVIQILEKMLKNKNIRDYDALDKIIFRIENGTNKNWGRNENRYAIEFMKYVDAKIIDLIENIKSIITRKKHINVRLLDNFKLLYNYIVKYNGRDQASDISGGMFQKELNDIKANLNNKFLEVNEIDLDKSALNNMDAIYQNILNYEPFDLGNNIDFDFPARNSLIAKNNYLYGGFSPIDFPENGRSVSTRELRHRKELINDYNWNKDVHIGAKKR